MSEGYFEVEEENCISNFVHNSIRGKQIAIQLKTSLFHRCILDDTTTIAELSTSKYSGFMSALQCFFFQWYDKRDWSPPRDWSPVTQDWSPVTQDWSPVTQYLLIYV